MGQPDPSRSLHSEIHVWRVRLDQPLEVVEHSRRLLSEDELDRTERFAFEHLRHRFAVGRAAVRIIVAAYLGERPEGIVFQHGQFGKPYLPPPLHGAPLWLNVSHSADLLLLAVTRVGEVGIDVEAMHPVPEALSIAGHYFTVREREWLESLSPDDLNRSFLCLWVAKEALLKAEGCGLQRPLNEVGITPVVPHDVTPRPVGILEPDLQRWRLSAFVPAEGFLGALAVDGDHGEMVVGDWDLSVEEPA